MAEPILPRIFERCLVLRQRRHVAVGEVEDRLAAQEVVPGLAQAPADLRRRPVLGQVLQVLERLDVAGAVDQRLHVDRVEPVDALGAAQLARGHGERGRQRHEVVEALLAHLEVQHRTAVRLAVDGVEVLAVEVGGDVLELLQRLRRRRQVVAVLRLERGHVLGVGEHVAAVVEDLAVGVAQHAVADVAPGVDASSAPAASRRRTIADSRRSRATRRPAGCSCRRSGRHT